MNSNVIHTKTLVIGAGYAGLTATALLAHNSSEVTLIESHDTLGGCASFFRTGKYSFDVGATTFAGVSEGQPAKEIFDQLGITPQLTAIDPGMVIRMDGQDINRVANHDEWVARCSEVFPGGNHQMFWDELQRIEKLAWRVVTNERRVLPSTVTDWLSLVRLRNVNYLPLLPTLFEPLSKLFKKYQLDSNDRFKRFVDEQLLISTQSTHRESPVAPSALGLMYPSSMFYPIGGMVAPALQLMRSAQSNGAQVLFRRNVRSITQQNNSWLIETSKETFVADTVVSSVPIWNMAELTSGHVAEYYRGLSNKYEQAWCALTVYAVVEGVPDLPSPYMQLHLPHNIHGVHSNSLFISMSMPGDRTRSVDGHTTITISTHCREDEWRGLSQAEHDQKKQQLTAQIVEAAKRLIPELGDYQWSKVEGGSPQTWQHYTSRLYGRVGGLPHTTKNTLLHFPKNVTPFKGLYQIGDTAFPGQGTPAVMVGARNTVDRIVAVA